MIYIFSVHSRCYKDIVEVSNINNRYHSCISFHSQLRKGFGAEVHMLRKSGISSSTIVVNGNSEQISFHRLSYLQIGNKY